MIRKKLYINGAEKNLIVDTDESLAEILCKRLRFTDTKVGCGMAQCASCDVQLGEKSELDGLAYHPFA